MIGDKIKARRLELGMTQEELAQKLGFKSKSSINKIELNKTDIPQKRISQFAKALETTPAFLMDWEKKKESLSPEMKELAKRVRITSTNQYYTKEEKELVKAYREADSLDKMIVMRTLGLESKLAAHPNDNPHAGESDTPEADINKL